MTNIKKIFTIYLIAISFCIIIISFKGMPHRNIYYETIFEGTYIKPYYVKEKYDCINQINLECKIIGDNKKLLLMGDSKAMSLQNKLVNFSIKNGYSFFSIINNSCPFMYNKKVSYMGVERKRCNQVNLDTEKYLKKNTNNIILYNARYSCNPDEEIVFKNKKNCLENYMITFKKLSKKNKIIIFLPLPENGTHIKHILNKKMKFVPYILRNKKIFEELDTSVTREVALKNQLEYQKMINSISKNDNITVYDSKRLFCDEKKCFNKIGSNLIYRDSHHLTNYGLEILFKDFEIFLNKQLLL